MPSKQYRLLREKVTYNQQIQKIHLKFWYYFFHKTKSNKKKNVREKKKIFSQLQKFIICGKYVKTEKQQSGQSSAVVEMSTVSQS